VKSGSRGSGDRRRSPPILHDRLIFWAQNSGLRNGAFQSPWITGSI
jgi:hypothetical protein